MGNNAASSMISMRGSNLSAPSQQTAQFDRLLEDCRAICVDRLSESLASMLDKVPGAFSDLADRAREGDARDMYLQAKVDAVALRGRFEAEFRTHYAAEFTGRASRRDKGTAASQFALSALELGVVDDDELAETLHVNDMTAKLRRGCEDELAALDRLLSRFAGGIHAQGESDPFDPQAICRAFALTCRAVEPNRKLRLVLLTLFHDHVLDDLRAIYRDLSTTLAERSFPTGIGSAMMRRPVGSAAAARAGAAATAAAAALSAAPSAGAAGVNAGPLGSVQEGSLVASLTRIQRAELGAPVSGSLSRAASLTSAGTANVVRELRGTSLASGLGPTDSAMLEIVALLFDQVFACEKIPPRMKGLIGQLQIPILKVTLLDKGFLCKDTHPARKLLHCLGDIAVSLTDDLDECSPLYDQVQKTVRELVDGFEDSLDIFARLHQELEAFVAWQNRPAEEQVELVARRVGYKERLALAKAVAQQEIVQRAESGSVPRVVLRFLTDHWVKVMLIAHAKHGGESEAWNKAVRTMDLLLWSVRTKHSPADRRILGAVLPRLLRRLNAGMRRLGTKDGERQRYFVKLMRLHVNAMNSACDSVSPPSPVPAGQSPSLSINENSPAAFAGLGGQASARFMDGAVPSKARAPSVMSEDDDLEPAFGPVAFHALTVRDPFGEGEIEIEEISLSGLSAGGKAALDAGAAGAADGDEHSRMADSLREGAWVDFRDERNNKKRARLFYISPLRRTYLFVNRQSGTVGEYSVSQLARELRAGRASVIQTTALFDQAMANLIGVRNPGASLH